MTAPTPHGFTDWQSHTGIADVMLLSQTNNSINAQATFGPFYTGNWPYLNLRCTSAGNPFKLQLSWFAEPAQLNFLAERLAVVAGSGSYNQALPIPAPWMSVNVIPGAVTPVVYTLRASVCGAQNFTRQSPLDSQVLRQTAVAVGIGATVTRTTVRTQDGLSYVDIKCTAATWTAFIGAVDETGAVTTIYTWDSADGRWHDLLYLPPMPIQVSVTNTSGAGATFDACIGAVP